MRCSGGRGQRGTRWTLSFYPLQRSARYGKDPLMQKAAGR